MSAHENGGKDRPMAHSKPDNLRPTPANSYDWHEIALSRIREYDALAANYEALEQERDELKRELDTYQNGYQGACMTCDPVGEQNKELREEIEQYKFLLEQAKTLREENMRLRNALSRAIQLWSAYISVTGNTRTEEELDAIRDALQTTEAGETVYYDTAKWSITWLTTILY